MMGFGCALKLLTGGMMDEPRAVLDGSVAWYRRIVFLTGIMRPSFLEIPRTSFSRLQRSRLR